MQMVDSGGGGMGIWVTLKHVFLIKPLHPFHVGIEEFVVFAASVADYRWMEAMVNSRPDSNGGKFFVTAVKAYQVPGASYIGVISIKAAVEREHINAARGKLNLRKLFLLKSWFKGSDLYFLIFGKLEESFFPLIVLSHKVNIEKALDLFLKGATRGSTMAMVDFAIDGVLRGAIGCGPPPKPWE
ncbi:hypothetical protein Tco_0442692 [Tanacetum coccineum]